MTVQIPTIADSQIPSSKPTPQWVWAETGESLQETSGLPVGPAWLFSDQSHGIELMSVSESMSQCLQEEDKTRFPCAIPGAV